MTAELEAAILENPDDDAPYLVYADWLMASGDPRGELIVMQHDADEAEGNRKKALRRAANTYFEKHAQARTRRSGATATYAVSSCSGTTTGDWHARGRRSSC